MEGEVLGEQKIRILVVCSFYTPYVLQLCGYMEKYYPQIQYSLLTNENVIRDYQERVDLFLNIYTYKMTKLRLFYNQLNNLPTFDIIHTLWMEPMWGINAWKIKRKARYWLNSVGGSDLYRFSKQFLVKVLQKRIVRYSDWISSENSQTMDYFYQVYGNKYRKIQHSICRFGVDIIDYIRKIKQSGEYAGINALTNSNNKIIVLCGTNAGENHQHFSMIEAISRMKEELKNRCHFIFPMTYPTGKEAYIKKVSERISRVTSSFTILTKYMNVEEMAKLAIATDIMVHVQTTDQLSSAMLSHMYNGNIVIAGNWLPYDSLRERGVFFLGVDKIMELTSKMQDVIENINYYKDKCRGNPDIVYQLSSWERTSGDWMHIYESLMKGEG